MNTSTCNETQNVSERSYDEIMADAAAAKVCPYRHHCERREFVTREWHMHAKPSPWEVWEKTNEEDDDATQEVIFSGTKEGCQEKYKYELSHMPDSFWLEERGRCSVCDMYEKRRAATKEGRQPSFLIVVYGISRHYLGPEEGGSWGDATEVLEVGRAYTWQGGLKLAREFREQYPTQRYGRGSVLGNGQDTYIRVVYAEADPRMPENYFPSRTYQ